MLVTWYRLFFKLSRDFNHVFPLLSKLCCAGVVVVVWLKMAELVVVKLYSGEIEQALEIVFMYALL